MGRDYKSRVQTLIDDIVRASQVPANKRSYHAKPIVTELTSITYSQGVLPNELIQVVGLIVSRSRLDQASLNSIIKNLYPVERVPEDVVLKIVGCLGLGELKPGLTIQSSLLQWVILVYHALHSKAQAVLSRAYGVLFNLLDVSAIRPQLLHILAIITRRKHVQHHRIQALMNLSRQVGNDRHLQGLLRVYRNYYPEIIVGKTGKESAFKLPDAEWQERLSFVQKAHRELQQSSFHGSRDGFSTIQTLGGFRGAKSTGLPPVQTSNAHEKSVTLEEIDNAEKLVLNLERIEMPDHVVAFLFDPLLQKFMMLRPDLNLKRASGWVDMLFAEILSGDAGSQTVEETLHVILQYARTTKDISPFFPALMKLVDLQLHLGMRTRIQDILAYAPMMNSKDLSLLTSTILKARPDEPVEAQLDLLDLYTHLLHRWTVTMLATEDEVRSKASQSVSYLISHVNQLSVTVLQTLPSELSALKIVDFYERVAHLYSQSTCLSAVQIAIPPAPLVYTLQFSTSLATVSRLCAVLVAYKQAFAVIMSKADKERGPGYDKDVVKIFNGFVMDICNCLWRGHAFTMRDAHAQGCMVSGAVTGALESYVGNLSEGGDMALGTLFTMSHSPLLCLQAAKHMRRLEEREDEEFELQARHAGPVTPRSLAQLARSGGLELEWQNYRLGMLALLEAMQCGGISDLLYSAVKNLGKAKKA